MENVWAETYLLLGSNEGDRMEMLNHARQMIATQVSDIISSSAVYETEPWGMSNAQAFLNQVLQLKTKQEPEELLQLLLNIEASMGRNRSASNPSGQYESRTIDIDILYMSSLVMNTDQLTLPHPRISERRFVLAPLAEIAPNFMHPVISETQQELLALCPDPLKVTVFHG